jgi:hypothetical protein
VFTRSAISSTRVHAPCFPNQIVEQRSEPALEDPAEDTPTLVNPIASQPWKNAKGFAGNRADTQFLGPLERGVDPGNRSPPLIRALTVCSVLPEGEFTAGNKYTASLTDVEF